MNHILTERDLTLAYHADAADTSLGFRTLAHLGRLLAKEKVKLVVVFLVAVRDEVHMYKGGI